MFRRLNLRQQEELTAWLFIAPNLVGFFTFTVIATISAFLLAFTHWDLLTPPKWAAFANFTRMWADPLFWKVLRNTFYYTFVSVPLTVALGLLLALAMNQGVPAIPLLRTAYFMPVVTSSYVIALVWRWFYSPDFGILNDMLRAIGWGSPPNWLASPHWAMPAVILLAVWKGMGYAMVIFLAGLQSIPSQLYEAASINGASAWQKFWRITLPLLTPTTFFVLVISFIGSFQVFDSVVALTEGGPANATRPLVLYIYEHAFTFLEMGYGAALSMVLFLVIFAITALQWLWQRRWVHYE